MNLFPILQPSENLTITELPLAKEVAQDFETGRPLWEKGVPVFVTGQQAIQVWVWKALVTPLRKYIIYSHSFGNQTWELIGHGFSEELLRAETLRYIEEALLPNPYITRVHSIDISFEGSVLTVSAYIDTIYGEVTQDATT